MKKLGVFVGVALILLGCSKDRLETGLQPNPGAELQPSSAEISKGATEFTAFGLPKPLKPNKAGARLESGVQYYLSDYGYVYGKSSNGFRKQITAYAQNLTGPEAIVTFDFIAATCIIIESIDNVVGGSAQIYSSSKRMVWNPANIGGEFMDNGQTSSVTFTIRNPNLVPYVGGNCVEGSIRMDMNSPNYNACNFTDDYAYLLPLINE